MIYAFYWSSDKFVKELALLVRVTYGNTSAARDVDLEDPFVCRRWPQ